MSLQTTPLWPFALYGLAVLALVAAILALSHVLGSRHHEPDTDLPYESGMNPVGTARLRLSAQFYLVALFFVIFDLEAVYLFAWAVAAREVGWAGYLEALAFIGVLLVALAYLWSVGALNWRQTRKQVAHAGRR